MPIDQLMKFSDEQALTSGTVESTNALDLKAAREFSNGARPLYLVCQVTTAFTDSGSDSTIAVTTETSADDSSYTASVQTIGTFAALSAVGTKLVVQLAPSLYNKRYLRLKYTAANGNLSTGKVTSYLTADPDLWTTFAAGYTGPSTS